MVRLLMILCLCLMPALASATDYPVTVTDSLGRQVTIPARPEAVLLGSGFNLVALSLIEDDPVRRLAGWSTDLKGDNPELYADFATRFPALADLPAIGDGTGGSLSLEVILTLRSDLAILANWQAETEDGRRLIAVLEETGVPVIVVDFNSNAIGNTPSAMRLLGTVLDREAEAEAFATFYEERLARIPRPCGCRCPAGADRADGRIPECGKMLLRLWNGRARRIHHACRRAQCRRSKLAATGRDGQQRISDCSRAGGLYRHILARRCLQPPVDRSWCCT